ncbi:MAG: trypsin-like peptidase domain-containing protein [Firmicutes bacterium]|nr:trypsin-like peptidase domain-containing protein [Bacillota bacterium]
MDHKDNLFEDNEQNFIIIGEAYDPDEVANEEATVSPEAVSEEETISEPKADEPVIDETREPKAEEPVAELDETEEPFETFGQVHFDAPPAAPKYVTRKAFVISMILCMIATSVLTVAGYTLASQWGVGSTTKRISATNYTLSQATGSEKSIEEIIAMNENAVVEIRTESVSMDIWMRNYVTEGAGSGVIVDTRGYILTCNHVIEGSSKVTITLKDGTELDASVVGTDPQNDLAVLKINATNLVAATYGNSEELSVGDLVVAIGNPLGELGGTASQGIISALDRELTVDNKNLTLLQTDASINPGNSGGGLFDQYGNLIGIVVAKSSGSDIEGLGFAIPINTAAEIAKALIEGESPTSTNKASIGIQVIEISDAQTAMQYNVQYTGVYIQDVTSQKAKKAGLKSGDMIYYFENNRIETFDDLSAALSKHKPGDQVNITVVRDNKTLDIEVELIVSQK